MSNMQDVICGSHDTTQSDLAVSLSVDVFCQENRLKISRVRVGCTVTFCRPMPHMRYHTTSGLPWIRYKARHNGDSSNAEMSLFGCPGSLLSGFCCDHLINYSKDVALLLFTSMKAFTSLIPLAFNLASLNSPAKVSAMRWARYGPFCLVESAHLSTSFLQVLSLVLSYRYTNPSCLISLLSKKYDIEEHDPSPRLHTNT